MKGFISLILNLFFVSNLFAQDELKKDKREVTSHTWHAGLACFEPKLKDIEAFLDKGVEEAAQNLKDFTFQFRDPKDAMAKRFSLNFEAKPFKFVKTAVGNKKSDLSLDEAKQFYALLQLQQPLESKDNKQKISLLSEAKLGLCEDPDHTKFRRAPKKDQEDFDRLLSLDLYVKDAKDKETRIQLGQSLGWILLHKDELQKKYASSPNKDKVCIYTSLGTKDGEPQKVLSDFNIDDPKIQEKLESFKKTIEWAQKQLPQ